MNPSPKLEGYDGGVPCSGGVHYCFCTYAQTPSSSGKRSGKQAFSGERRACTPAELLQEITQDRNEAGNGNRMRVALIMPSTFHLRSTIHKELPNGAEMLLYCGIVDLDAEPHHAGSKQALKANIEEAIRSGASVEEVCGACPDFGSVVKAAQVMCAKLREKGFAPICWFTGGKGVRVAWFDPACYMRYRKGDKDVSTMATTGMHWGRHYTWPASQLQFRLDMARRKVQTKREVAKALRKTRGKEKNG